MTLDEAYGWSAAPVRLLANVETAMANIGVPVGPEMAQAIVLIGGGMLAGAFWVQFFTIRGKADVSRVIVLVAALGLTLLILPIPIFWIQVTIHPPPGEIFGSLDDATGGWGLDLLDNRDHKMAEGNVDEAARAFTIYYSAALGQVPSVIHATKDGCKPVEKPLTYDQVFRPEPVRMVLKCTPN